MSARPLIVSIFGGPGAGKSTTAAQVFGALKLAGRNVELVHEYAKDLTWEKAWGKLDHQPYVAAKQMWHLDRLSGQVEVVVTDTATLLGLIYGKDNTAAFETWLVDDYRSRNTLNIMLDRDPWRPYNPSGRRQSKESAQAKDHEIEQMLTDLCIPYQPVRVNVADHSHVDRIVSLAVDRLPALTISAGVIEAGKITSSTVVLPAGRIKATLPVAVTMPVHEKGDRVRLKVGNRHTGTVVSGPNEEGVLLVKWDTWGGTEQWLPCQLQRNEEVPQDPDEFKQDPRGTAGGTDEPPYEPDLAIQEGQEYEEFYSVRHRKKVRVPWHQIVKHTYVRQLSRGTQTRYALKASVQMQGDEQPCTLTKFVGQDDWDRIQARKSGD